VEEKIKDSEKRRLKLKRNAKWNYYPSVGPMRQSK